MKPGTLYIIKEERDLFSWWKGLPYLFIEKLDGDWCKFLRSDGKIVEAKLELLEEIHRETRD